MPCIWLHTIRKSHSIWGLLSWFSFLFLLKLLSGSLCKPDSYRHADAAVTCEWTWTAQHSTDSRVVTPAKSFRYPCLCERGWHWMVLTEQFDEVQAQCSSTLLALTQQAGLLWLYCFTEHVCFHKGFINSSRKQMQYWHTMFSARTTPQADQSYPAIGFFLTIS